MKESREEECTMIILVKLLLQPIRTVGVKC